MEQMIGRRAILVGASAVLLAGCAVDRPRPTTADSRPSSAGAPPKTSTTPIVSPTASSAAPTPSATLTPTIAPPSTATATPKPTSTKPAKDTRSGAELDQPYTVDGIPVVSRKLPISKRYEPRDPSTHGLEREVAVALAELTAAAKADGVKVKVYSAYRSYAEQDKLLKDKIVEYGNEKLARRYNAEPGKSRPTRRRSPATPTSPGTSATSEWSIR